MAFCILPESQHKEGQCLSASPKYLHLSQTVRLTTAVRKALLLLLLLGLAKYCLIARLSSYRSQGQSSWTRVSGVDQIFSNAMVSDHEISVAMVSYCPSSSNREVAHVCERRSQARLGMPGKFGIPGLHKLDGSQWLESLTLFLLVQLLFQCLFFLISIINLKRLLLL